MVYFTGCLSRNIWPTRYVNIFCVHHVFLVLKRAPWLRPILRIEAILFERTDCPTPFGALQRKMYARKISWPHSNIIAPLDSTQHLEVTASQTLLNWYPTTTSGAYWIGPDREFRANLLKVLYDMGNDRGGWTSTVRSYSFPISLIKLIFYDGSNAYHPETVQKGDTSQIFKPIRT